MKAYRVLGCLLLLACSAVAESNKDQDIVTEKETVSDNEYYHDSRTDKYYKFYSELRTWFDAQSRCHSDGGHLAVINSPKEALVLAELFAKHPLQNDLYDSCAYIGFFLFHLEPMYNVWITVLDFPQTLEEAGYSRWGNGEPNNLDGKEFYGCMLRNGRLNDESYNKTHPFICEMRYLAEIVDIRFG